MGQRSFRKQRGRTFFVVLYDIVRQN